MTTARETIVVKSEAEVADAVLAAVSDKSPFEIVSSGSKRDYGRPVSAERTLDVSALKGVIKYEPEELVFTARAATPMKDIEATLAERKQMLGFEPVDWGALFGGDSGRATLAGALTTNACGARRVKAGAVRDHVIGCRFVNGSGETIKAGGHVIKNVTGFDVPKLMCGAFGTLGVLTELTLRVVPLPARTVAFAVPMPSAEAGLRALRQAAVLPVDPTGLAYLPEAALKASVAARAASFGGVAGVSVIRVEGAMSALTEKLALLRQTFAGFDVATFNDGVTASLFREIGAGGLFVNRATDVWRLCVPSSAAHEAVQRSGAEFWYADWAGGMLWLALPGDEQTATRLRAITARLGGHATLMRASAAARATLPVFEPEAPTRAGLTRAVKAAFDPHRLFNPDRMFKDC
jgi:glycolate oxidase FAD binding subunit